MRLLPPLLAPKTWLSPGAPNGSWGGVAASEARNGEEAAMAARERRCWKVTSSSTANPETSTPVTLPATVDASSDASWPPTVDVRLPPSLLTPNGVERAPNGVAAADWRSGKPCGGVTAAAEAAAAAAVGRVVLESQRGTKGDGAAMDTEACCRRSRCGVKGLGAPEATEPTPVSPAMELAREPASDARPRLSGVADAQRTGEATGGAPNGENPPPPSCEPALVRCRPAQMPCS